MLVGKGLRCRLVLEEGGHRDKLGNTLCGSVWTIILPHTSAPTQNTIDYKYKYQHKLECKYKYNYKTHTNTNHKERKYINTKR